MNPYDNEELERIEKVKEKNTKLEEYLNEKREEWNDNINPLFDKLKNNFNSNDFETIIDIQSLALTYRQNISEQISFFLNKRSKEEVKLKTIRQDKFMYYALGFGLKTNLSEKNLLIEAHISENERSMQLLENYVEFLRSCSKNLESLGYTIKNIIELMNYLKR